MAQRITIQNITIQQFSVFTGHGHVQHAGAEWSGQHSLRYHIYFVLDGQYVQKDVSYAYHNRIRIETYLRERSQEGQQVCSNSHRSEANSPANTPNGEDQDDVGDDTTESDDADKEEKEAFDDCIALPGSLICID